MDQWARDEKLKQYESPIANLIYQYSLLVDNELAARPTDFRPTARQNAGEGEGDLIKRYNEIRTGLTKLSQQKSVEELEDLPPLATLATNIEFQRALFNHELDPELCAWLGSCKMGPRPS